jgi:hypothetical protein
MEPTRVTDEAAVDADSADECCIDEALDLEMQHRLWLKAALPILQARKIDEDLSPRVQLALDKAAIAICERIGRISRSDLPKDRA